jgi:apolipoprotein D and lipocalin family protein
MHRPAFLRPEWLLALLLLAGAVAANLPAIRPVPHVDLTRFMGTWYLVGGIPTAFERDAWNAVETYTLRKDGSIRTTLTFNQGGANGPRKHIEAPARVRPGTNNAVWDVRVFGPVKAQYVVAWLRDDYSLMLVARDARDYAWVFARSREVPAADLELARQRLRGLGYNLANWRTVPHSGTTFAESR